ncbi:RING finger protein nenya [Drosophila navojoa]|uniref:RING finger protein nenya n=1 Tax=Drosophila navojoa TaxID=7232 RepID=UPI00084635CA|nr:RING finger protein nenya [Drosophila navojoa]
MFPVHCNSCFKKREAAPGTEYLLSRCHHIVCANCAPNSTNGERKCPVCNRSFSSVAITSSMPTHAANYFTNPSIFLKMYRSISQFQSDQRNSYYANYYKNQAQLPKKKLKLQGYLKLEAQLREQNDNEMRRITELRNYIDYYERNDEKFLGNASYSSSDISSTSRMINRPRTPSLSATDETTLTDEADMNESAHMDRFDKLLSQATLTISQRSKLKRSKRRDSRNSVKST